MCTYSRQMYCNFEVLTLLLLWLPPASLQHHEWTHYKKQGIHTATFSPTVVQELRLQCYLSQHKNPAVLLYIRILDTENRAQCACAEDGFSAENVGISSFFDADCWEQTLLADGRESKLWKAACNGPLAVAFADWDLTLCWIGDQLGHAVVMVRDSNLTIPATQAQHAALARATHENASGGITEDEEGSTPNNQSQEATDGDDDVTNNSIATWQFVLVVGVVLVLGGVVSTVWYRQFTAYRKQRAKQKRRLKKRHERHAVRMRAEAALWTSPPPPIPPQPQLANSEENENEQPHQQSNQPVNMDIIVDTFGPVSHHSPAGHATADLSPGEILNQETDLTNPQSADAHNVQLDKLAPPSPSSEQNSEGEDVNWTLCNDPVWTQEPIEEEDAVVCTVVLGGEDP
eukprot:TRINITY_DN55849_c0_g1_i1.p2 TRINITY_DN55849_c0_g1~~TRINITY_DN55849_c0_g1_i1.p2  ORF type:complete len:402 (-),score=44.62 TRINITY_DN55849_c0_g1_i1:2730-3935(-)